MADEIVNAGAAEAAAAQAAADAANQTDVTAAVDPLDAAMAKFQESDKGFESRYRRLIQAAKAEGIDTERLKARAKFMDDDEARPARRTAAPNPELQAELEQQIASGQFNPDTFADIVADKLQPRLVKATERALMHLSDLQTIKDEGVGVLSNIYAMGQDYGLTEVEVETAMKEANDIGIDTERRGGPSQWGVITAKIIRSTALEKAMSLRTTTAVVNAEEKARAAMLAQQPGKGAGAALAKPTREQELLKAMQDVGPKGFDKMLGT
jgi:hypothetical protein